VSTLFRKGQSAPLIPAFSPPSGEKVAGGRLRGMAKTCGNGLHWDNEWHIHVEIVFTGIMNGISMWK
jgi:hypothetical protein